MRNGNGRRHPTEHDSILVDALKGAVAGGIAVWVMDQVDWFNYEREDPEVRRRTQQARPEGMDPAHVSVNKAAEMAGTELSPHQPHPAGVAMHYSLGIGPGALYGALRDRVPMLRTGRGSLYGVGLFLMQDEGINAATGLAGKPTDYPWEAHARGLVAHAIYGVVLDTVLGVLKGPGRLIRYAPEEQEQSYERAGEYSSERAQA
jgi:hypothetical protein